MLKNKLFIIVLFCIAISPTVSFTQKEGYLQIFGNIRNDSTNIEGAEIKVMQNNAAMESFTTGVKIFNTAANGKFSFNLPFNGEYVVYISKQGFQTRSISISTIVPDKEKEIIFQYKINVKLVSASGNAEAAIDKPFVRIVYDSTYEVFDGKPVK